MIGAQEAKDVANAMEGLLLACPRRMGQAPRLEKLGEEVLPHGEVGWLVELLVEVGLLLEAKRLFRVGGVGQVGQSALRRQATSGQQVLDVVLSRRRQR